MKYHNYYFVYHTSTKKGIEVGSLAQPFEEKIKPENFWWSMEFTRDEIRKILGVNKDVKVLITFYNYIGYGEING